MNDDPGCRAGRSGDVGPMVRRRSFLAAIVAMAGLGKLLPRRRPVPLRLKRPIKYTFELTSELAAKCEPPPMFDPAMFDAEEALRKQATYNRVWSNILDRIHG